MSLEATELELQLEAVLDFAEEEGIEVNEEQLAEIAEILVSEESQDDKLDRVYQKLRRDPRDKKRRDQERQDKREKRAAMGESVVSESIAEMMVAAHEKDPTAFGAAFNSAIMARVADRLDAMRPAVAASLFGDKE